MVMAIVNREGEAVKVAILTASKLEMCALSYHVGEWAAARCLYREVFVSAVIVASFLVFFETKGTDRQEGWPQLVGTGRGE